ncbi:AraC family transcriptional regulator N-terminal domain-containing protein [Sodalis sp. RH16]|uniref:AraC family transcriptional regulator n=1 Tax=Sodalis sp. RH16 TaxID=3394331 RepID=UPI0039B52877
MNHSLLSAVGRYADTHADSSGVARTPIPGLSVIRATMPSELQYAISRPLAALVLQGGKRVTTGSRSFSFGEGDSLVIAAHVPTISQITKASLGVPYYSLVLEFDPAVIETLAMEMNAARVSKNFPVRVAATENEVADAALRLMRLLERPEALPLLQSQLIREMHYWLLVGHHGASIRALGVAQSHAQRISKAVAIIREEFSHPLRVERLAQAAGMSISSFHQHFRTVTSLSPLQFQKQLRLIEARRIMLADGKLPSHVAYEVGYESVPQFTREYSRMFGAPPVRDIRQVRDRLTTMSAPAQHRID